LSRTPYLFVGGRARARPLHRALRAAEAEVAGGVLDAPAVLAAARGELDAAGLEPEYLELRSTTDLSPVERVNGSTLLAVAARVGRARLIDNTILGGAS
jgi:pantoate--beta-alanine ligase